MVETKSPYQPQNSGQNAGDPTLRHFFDDWPRSLHDSDNASHSATNLSISTSDFSLKLGSGNGEECRGGEEGSRPWGMAWEAAHRGGPLAEALRSSMATSSSSPTSVLHRLQRSYATETSYVTS